MSQFTSAHTEARPGHGGGFPPFQRETFDSQLLWLAISFILLYSMVAKLGLPRIRSIHEARQRRITADFDEVRQLKARSEAALAGYTKAVTDARNQAQSLLHQARDRIDAEERESRGELQRGLSLRLANAENAIAIAKTTALANLRSIAVETSSALVLRLTGTVPIAKAVMDAVDRVLLR